MSPFGVYCEKLSPSRDSNHGTKWSALFTIIVIIIIIIITHNNEIQDYTNRVNGDKMNTHVIEHQK